MRKEIYQLILLHITRTVMLGETQLISANVSNLQYYQPIFISNLNSLPFLLKSMTFTIQSKNCRISIKNTSYTPSYLRKDLKNKQLASKRLSQGIKAKLQQVFLTRYCHQPHKHHNELCWPIQINSSNLHMTSFQHNNMNIKELFQELQDHEFDCITFMKVTNSEWKYIHQIVSIMTDNELRTLTISFENMVESLKHQENRKQLQRRVCRAQEKFLDEKRKVELPRKIPGRSIASQVQQLIRVKIPMAIIILIVVDNTFQTDNQCYSKQFWIVLGILSVVLLLDMLDTYFKWKNQRRPASYQARLQDGGLWSRLMDIKDLIHHKFSTKPSTGIDSQNMQENIIQKGTNQFKELEEQKTVEQQPSSFSYVQIRPGFSQFQFREIIKHSQALQERLLLQ